MCLIDRCSSPLQVTERYLYEELSPPVSAEQVGFRLERSLPHAVRTLPATSYGVLHPVWLWSRADWDHHLCDPDRLSQLSLSPVDPPQPVCTADTGPSQ